MPSIFPPDRRNKLIGFLQGERQPFSMFASNVVPNLAFFSLDYGQCLPLIKYNSEGASIDNITTWALERFTNHYSDLRISNDMPNLKVITKENIFNYAYGVLHDPTYRKKYALNLKKEFPRIPFYDNFWQWAAWGEQLMDLHINYETAAPYILERKEIATKEQPKGKLKAQKETGTIILDDNTELHGIPAIAWDYKLGNRSALEWVLDQYKEKKPSDPTIAEKFNTYRFADYKEQVIDLLKRVCTVSAETMKIIGDMEKM